jgi:glutathione peroxidase
MMKVLSILATVLSLSLSSGLMAKQQKKAEFYQYELPGLSGKPIKMADYGGKVVMLVNTASHCGFTKQYKDLQQIFESYQGQGLVVVGVPSDSFNQEFKDDKEVAKFCEMNYGVRFPMARILPVKGKDAHPLFQHLTANSPGDSKEIAWNFEKFLIDHKGKVRYHFGSRVSPSSSEVKQAISTLLKEAKPS